MAGSRLGFNHRVVTAITKRRQARANGWRQNKTFRSFIDVRFAEGALARFCLRAGTPDVGGCIQAANRQAATHHRSGAQESEAGDNLARDACGARIAGTERV